MSRIAQIRAAAAGAPAPDEADENPITETEDEDDGTPPADKSKQKEPGMADNDQNAAVETAKKEADAAGFKRASDRFAAVMASEDYKGREAYAGKLLTKESLANASAEDIIDLLADGPKVETTALTEEQQRAAAEEGGRKEMQDALAKNKNSNIDADAGNGGGKDKAADAAGIWDRATARVFPEVRK